MQALQDYQQRFNDLVNNDVRNCTACVCISLCVYEGMKMLGILHGCVYCKLNIS